MLGSRTELTRIEGKYKVLKKLLHLLPSIELRGVTMLADDLDNPLATLESRHSSQMSTAVAIVKESSAT